MKADLELGRYSFNAVKPIIERAAKGDRVQWAEDINMSVSLMNRCYDTTEKNRDYYITFSKVPLHCVHMDTDLPIRWLISRFHFLKAQFCKNRCEPLDPDKALRIAVQLMKEVGQAAEAIERAIADGKIESIERKRIRREVGDVVSCCLEIMEGLAAIDDEEGR